MNRLTQEEFDIMMEQQTAADRYRELQDAEIVTLRQRAESAEARVAVLEALWRDERVDDAMGVLWGEGDAYTSDRLREVKNQALAASGVEVLARGWWHDGTHVVYDARMPGTELVPCLVIRTTLETIDAE